VGERTPSHENGSRGLWNPYVRGRPRGAVTNNLAGRAEKLRGHSREGLCGALPQAHCLRRDVSGLVLMDGGKPEQVQLCEQHSAGNRGPQESILELASHRS
jgi:hypothetical protein